ncbi:hypothetical protein ACIBH1_17910 [Nonomuraea sp. NPDC050663]|uniref:hypothetical protein n=1 Tax=Nonomuraea sp. NPDC050663 TaxID=3364370 RepID=UPI0037A1A9B8
MRIDSSSREVVELFEWACERALRWAHPAGVVGVVDADEHHPEGRGTGVYLASYWAGYAHRSGFYARDFAHQLVGAHLLGLQEANLAMLRCFAASATEEHGHHPVWAFNFDGSYLAIDYRGPDDFVREAPAVYELVEAGMVAYRWSGDRAFLDDPVLRDFYRDAMAVRPRVGGASIFDGVATYNELPGEVLTEAGDMIASEYAACLAVGSVERALALRERFAREWTGSGAGQVRGFTPEGGPVTGWGRENSWFMPLKGIMAEPHAYLDYIDEQAWGAGRPANVEALTYLPDTFFRHGRLDQGWAWMREIFAMRDLPHVAGGRNGDYPEVSFTLVAQVVEGLLGLRPDGTVRPGLPEGIDWLEISGIPLGAREVTVRKERDGVSSA